MDYIFTSESVSDGHPDKVADQISDALVDAGLKNGDETTRIAIETLVTTNHVTLAGEVKNFNVTNKEIDRIVREKVREIGYEQDGFDWKGLTVVDLIHNQSSDIALGTDDFGAGDQGIMFGYACNDNQDFLPAPIYFAHEILKMIKGVRGIADRKHVLGPDAKSQVSVQYENGKVKRIDQVVISTQHAEGFYDEAVRIAKECAEYVLGNLVDKDTVWHLNPTGNFVIGGPDGDAGVTGRKIIVDTYGGYAPHGGGAFSGKDPTKVDRTASYMARYLAKKVVNNGMADNCLIQLSYSIGEKNPTSVYVKSNGSDSDIHRYIVDNFDLTPYGMIEKFDMFNFYEYSKNCVYGHFGNKDVPWEKM
jgi:S-adenosylmethionine synthetase